MPHQNHKKFILTSLVALMTAASLSASFDSLINELGLSKDSKISTARHQLSPIFDVKDVPKTQLKKGEKVEVKRTPLEIQILNLHKAVVDLGFETHPLDRELWGSFLVNLAAMRNLSDSVHPAFRKNQIAEMGQRLSELGESYERDVVGYFFHEKPQMLGKAIVAIDKIEARYMALYAVHEFMTRYWANDQAELLAPLMISAIRLSQVKLIEGVFEKEFETQLNQQRKERQKEKAEKTEIPEELTEGPSLLLEEKTPPESSDSEITRDEIKIKYSDVLEKLKGRFLPIEVKSWDLESSLTYKELQFLLSQYQIPFDEISNLAFPKSQKEEIEEPETLIVKKKEVLTYDIPKPLRTFKHPGIFSMLKDKLGTEKADEYLFLRCLALLEEMQNEKSDQKKLMEKLKKKWRIHITQGQDSNPENVNDDKFFEAFLKTYTNWSLQNKGLSKVRSELESSSPLKVKYDLFMNQHSEQLKNKKEEEVKQLLTMMVGPQAWDYHLSLQKKTEPKGNLKPLEETLRKIWVESVLTTPTLKKKTVVTVSTISSGKIDPSKFVF